MERPGMDPQEVEKPRDDLERVTNTQIIDEEEVFNCLRDLCGLPDDEIYKMKNKPWTYWLGRVNKELGLAAQMRDRGRYDVTSIERFTNIYIHLCDSFNKGISFYVLGVFLGIEDERIIEWGTLAQYANSGLRGVYTKIKRSSEETVRSYANDAAARGNGLAMALLANHDHGWDDRGKVAQITGQEPSTDAIADQISNLIAQKVEKRLEK
jgi:hypothetical protein